MVKWNPLFTRIQQQLWTVVHYPARQSITERYTFYYPDTSSSHEIAISIVLAIPATSRRIIFSCFVLYLFIYFAFLTKKIEWRHDKETMELAPENTQQGARWQFRVISTPAIERISPARTCYEPSAGSLPVDVVLWTTVILLKNIRNIDIKIYVYKYMHTHTLVCTLWVFLL